jgi:hypothetical protein
VLRPFCRILWSHISYYSALSAQTTGYVITFVPSLFSLAMFCFSIILLKQNIIQHIITGIHLHEGILYQSQCFVTCHDLLISDPLVGRVNSLSNLRRFCSDFSSGYNSVLMFYFLNYYLLLSVSLFMVYCTVISVAHTGGWLIFN